MTYDESGRILLLERGLTRSITEEVRNEVLIKSEKHRVDFGVAMAARYGSTSQLFWAAVDGRPVRPEDLKLLSRFSPRREAAAAMKVAREVRWSQWVEAQLADRA